MQDLIQQECFEMEVLERLNSRRLLEKVLFCGGTMLRLCFGLNRYSVDLDFWILKADVNTKKLFAQTRQCLEESNMISDAADKHYTMLFEVKSPRYPRRLKIEMRKEPRDVQTEQAIAYSQHSNRQFFVTVPVLAETMQAKAAAFLDRKEIRDVFDMEFLVKKGVDVDLPSPELRRLLEGIEKLRPIEYAQKLGSVLEAKERRYYRDKNFRILKSAIQEKLERE